MAGRKQIEESLEGIAGKIFYDELMSRRTSLRVGGNAAALVVVESEGQAAQIVDRLGQAKINYLPVGNLTNLIVRDGGYNGVIMLMSGMERINYQQVPEGEDHFVSAQSGAALSKVVGFCATCGLTGLEFCAGIPGSVGGAVWMNAGAFGKEIKDVVGEVSLIDPRGRKRTMRKEEISFAYRRTDLPAGTIITDVLLRLKKGDSEQIKEKIREIIQIRMKKHPLDYPSAGSVFKNPPGMTAGRIIEEIGLKGMRCGGAEVSRQHANFIVNKGNACAADVLELIGLIQKKAREEKGVDLEPEVIVVGEDPCRKE
ncbi:MAG TPA: UDP-N-acetylmuramate dehydrogenase [Smithellaceae bacterium]|nr:UDP-N-acetylmuramate dehydrogenase [Smithellaceae bacterium]